MRKLIWGAAGCAAALICWAGKPERIDPSGYLADVRFLSSEALAGRGTGTEGLQRAAGYIAAGFQRAGLRNGARDGFLQAFPITIGARLGTRNELRVRNGHGSSSMVPERDFIPLNFSGSGRVAAGVVFAGYGITAPEYGYDDYAGLDAAGKIVIVLKHEPQEYETTSVFEGRVYTQHSQLATKAANVRKHGGVAMLLVNDTAAHPGAADTLEKFVPYAAPGNAGVPLAHVKAEKVEEWLKAAGKDVTVLQQAIDRDLRAQSCELDPELMLTLRTDVRRESKNVNNVLGYLPGKTTEYIVVGAHYDHLGRGEQYSLDGGKPGIVHPGADDNASGTAGVLALARRFAAGPPMRRGVLFVAFAGEELGLLGSSYFVENPVIPLDAAVAMINMDMIGRVRDGRVYIGGLGTGTGFNDIVSREKARYPFSLESAELGGYGSSDHTTFFTRQIPSLFFFSGLHGDYHKPSDTWEKINAPAAALLLELISEVIEEIGQAESKPGFQRPADAHAPSSGAMH